MSRQYTKHIVKTYEVGANVVGAVVVGLTLGLVVSPGFEGAIVGEHVEVVGEDEIDGVILGLLEGVADGIFDGDDTGFNVGDDVGEGLGSRLGANEYDGPNDGF